MGNVCECTKDKTKEHTSMLIGSHSINGISLTMMLRGVFHILESALNGRA